MSGAPGGGAITPSTWWRGSLWLAVILVGACGVPSPPASSAAPATWEPTASPEALLTHLRDPRALTTALRVATPDHLALTGGTVVAGDQPTELLLQWRGRACEIEPTITVSGSLPDAVLVRVDRGPLAVSGCMDGPAGRAIVLTFRGPVDAGATMLEVIPGVPS